MTRTWIFNKHWSHMTQEERDAWNARMAETYDKIANAQPRPRSVDLKLPDVTVPMPREVQLPCDTEPTDQTA